MPPQKAQADNPLLLKGKPFHGRQRNREQRDAGGGRATAKHPHRAPCSAQVWAHWRGSLSYLPTDAATTI